PTAAPMIAPVAAPKPPPTRAPFSRLFNGCEHPPRTTIRPSSTTTPPRIVCFASMLHLARETLGSYIHRPSHSSLYQTTTSDPLLPLFSLPFANFANSMFVQQVCPSWTP